MPKQVELEYIGGPHGLHVPGYPARDFTCDPKTATELLAYTPPVYRVRKGDDTK